jgi:hypothetical protein
MTSATLVKLFAGERWAGDEKVRITATEVYFAATQAQKEILARTTYLEGKGQLALAANTDQYTFPVQTITNVQVVAGTVQLTMASHKFNTNDEGFFWGIGGAVEANGRYIVTKVDANTISLNGLTTCTTYTSGGQATHIINGAKTFLPSGIKLISDTTGSLIGVLEKRTKSWVEMQRNLFGPGGQPTSSTPTNQAVRYFYEEFTEPLTIGLLGTPETAMLLEPIFYRKHIDGYDDISATVNPLLGGLYDMVLQTGMMYHIFKFRPEKGAALETKKWMDQFEIEIAKFNRVHGRQKQVEQFDDIGIVW